MSRVLRRVVVPTVLTGVALAGSVSPVTSASAQTSRPVVGAARPATSAGAPRTATFVSRITARPSAVTDRARRVWAPVPPSLGTRHRSTRLAGKDVLGTTDDVLYQVNAWGTPGYQLPVPARDTYTVRLLMAEDTFAKAGQRVFDVRAEGRNVARVDIARAVGKGRAYDVRFAVAVTDGVLDLDFVRRVDQPLISAIEVTGRTRLPATALAAFDAPRQAVRFAPGNVFTTRIDKAPLAPNSAAAAAGVRRQVQDNWGGTAGVSAYSYNVGFNVAPRGTKRIRIGFHDCQKKRHVPSGLYDGAAHFVGVPVPAAAKATVGTDASMTIYDPATDQLWDFWQMRRNPRTQAWEACWGGRIDRVSTQTRPVFPAYFGASASGLALAGGMITIDEATRGRIDHVMGLSLIDVARWDRVSWPANRSDGVSVDPNAVREGQRLRLDPRLDLRRYDLTPFGRMVAEAAQRHGFLVVDKGGAVAVSTEFGLVHRARTGRDPWDRLLGGPAYDALKNFPWQSIQVLPADLGRPAG